MRITGATGKSPFDLFVTNNIRRCRQGLDSASTFNQVIHPGVIEMFRVTSSIPAFQRPGTQARAKKRAARGNSYTRAAHDNDDQLNG
jgi:hypothetical protein